MTNYDVIKKILGRIEPQGESNIDEVRYGNLMETIQVVNQLLTDIKNVSYCAVRSEYSMNKAGKKAQESLEIIKELLED